MKKFLTFILSIVLLCAISTSFGCETEELDNTDYTAFLEFTEIKDGDKVTGYSVKGKEGSTEKDIIIPAKYNGKPVELEYFAFWGNQFIESVVIRNGVTKMDEAAFGGCTNLKEVSLPNSLVELPRGAFVSCTALEDITLPRNIKTIKDQAFRGCTELKSITLSREQIEIQQDAFDRCENLKAVYWYEELPEGVDGNMYFEGITIDCTTNVCFLPYPTEQQNHYAVHVKWYHYHNTKPKYDVNDQETYFNWYWHYDKNGHKVIWEQN